MSIHAADALMEIFGFKRVTDEKQLDNPPSLDDDSGSLNEGIEMSEVKNEGLEVVNVRAIVTDAFISMMESALGMKAPDCAPPAFIQSAIDRAIDRINSEALAGYAVRDARIAELEEEVKTSTECLDMANELYETHKDKNGQLRAELAALNAKLDASKFCADVADDLRAELADAKETIMRYETTTKNCEEFRDALAAIYADPVAKQDNAAKMPCGAAVSNVYEAYEAGLVAKQVVLHDGRNPERELWDASVFLLSRGITNDQ